MVAGPSSALEPVEASCAERGWVKNGLRGSPALCSGGGGRGLRRLLTGAGICERALWGSPAARDQLWRDVPTTPRAGGGHGVLAR